VTVGVAKSSQEFGDYMEKFIIRKTMPFARSTQRFKRTISQRVVIIKQIQLEQQRNINGGVLLNATFSRLLIPLSNILMSQRQPLTDPGIKQIPFH